MVPRLPLIAVSAALFAASPSVAQDAEVANDTDTIEQLKSCRAIADPMQRLTCYDREVGQVITATEQGTLQVVDQQDVEDTKRRLFGFSLPNLKLFGGDEGELTELETTITRVRREGREGWIFTTEEGSTWRIAETKLGWRPPRPGQTVVFKRAAMGSFFIRVNGQIGVKGRRIE
ncbi:hypothetical protein [Erythrobacter litoralis]|uniref:Uncharacterized protein n=1 Tax=Erythrobacter litoralis (strain HTCC2594) TaxID=314225 RepID=Q2ND59_ERYLH|nr:hypothetical protein [Erythrobacter litoralis]ABC62382.1 hypothetical protein ELI_01450 [Erythrobacter litoralis HTCC2594]